jgi:hypothetical protein
VNKDILSGLALDEPVTLRSIEPLHCSLFLHCTNLEIEIALPLLVRLLGERTAVSTVGSPKCRDSLQPAKKGCEGLTLQPPERVKRKYKSNKREAQYTTKPVVCRPPDRTVIALFTAQPGPRSAHAVVGSSRWQTG